MHWVDLILELVLPTFLPPLVVGGNWLALWSWWMIIEWDGVHTHSGFDFWPGVIPGATRHWIHHIMYLKNYSNGISDYWFGTELIEKSNDAAVYTVHAGGRGLSSLDY